MGIVDQTACPVKTGTIYPSPYREMMVGRSSLRLGDAAGLTDFGANLVMLEPGAMSSLRHWHLHEDEFVMIVQGVCTLVTDQGATDLSPGDCAAFKAGDPDGHHFINHTDSEVRFLVIGSRAPREVATYSDVDFRVEQGGGVNTFTYRDGSPWEGPR